MFIYKTAKSAPVWTSILKIWAAFVHQTLTEHSLCPCVPLPGKGMYGFKIDTGKYIRLHFNHYERQDPYLGTRVVGRVKVGKKSNFTLYTMAKYVRNT